MSTGQKKLQLVDIIEQQLDDQKAREIETIDLKGAAQFADVMIVASGTSTRHVAALARGVQDKVRETFHQKPIGLEGMETSDWVLVDFGDIIVHIMLPATRQFYELEKLWRVRPDQHQPSANTADTDTSNSTDQAADDQNQPSAHAKSTH